MKKALSLILTAAMLCSLAACSDKGGEKPDNTDSDSKKPLKDITICLDWTPNTNHTGLFVAKSKGYYEAEGLNVSIVQPAEDSAALLCATGKAQFAIEFQDTMAAALAQDEPLGITAVAAVLQHNTSGIISRKGEGIDTPKGLEGKVYNTWNSPIEQAIIKSVMEKQGADFSKLQMVKTDISDEAAALKAKDVDAIWIFYGWSGIAAKQQGFEFDYFDFISIDKVFDYYTPVIIANNDFLKNDPDTAKAFLRATAKGYGFAAENPDEAAQILVDSDTTGSLSGSIDLVKASQEWISKKYIDDAEKWGVIDSARWDGFYKWLWDNKLIEVEIKSGTGLSTDYLE